MKQGLVAFLFLVPLCGCYEASDDPEARTLLAQCKISPDAHGLGEKQNPYMFDLEYLSVCMQSKGYVEDNNLYDFAGVPCSELRLAALSPECYRPDNTIAKWLAQVAARKSN